jgi:oligopeptide/dipeptide ABC transporter ATP-binding protein
VSELLRVENLHTWFHLPTGTVMAVDGVSLSVSSGRTLGLVGDSGSGKSITSLSIMRLVDWPGRVQPGSVVLFEGRDLTAMSENELRKLRGSQISMIFQEPMTSLNPLMTVGDQLTEAQLLHQKISRRAARDRNLEMLQLVGIPSPERRLHDYPHQLSGGMSQRVMIAMALACNPKLLIADEPTTALDVTVQAQIMQLLRDLRDRLGMAILLITHDLGLIAEMADDVAVMYAGRIVEYGSVESVITHPKHPYTQALLRSVPVLGMAQDRALDVIRGMVPSPADWPIGCRFAPRCDFAFERCTREHPPFHGSAAQKFACWLDGSGMRLADGNAP